MRKRNNPGSIIIDTIHQKGAPSLTLPSEYLTVLTHYKTLKIYY